MKRLIYAAIFIAVPFLCFSQEKVKEPIVTKDKTGTILSVEFPDGIQASKVPSSSEAFFTDFLQISVNDEFRKIPRKEKKKNFSMNISTSITWELRLTMQVIISIIKTGKCFMLMGIM